MSSRMDRYNDQIRSISSRTTKNQQLYKELYSNKTYTEFTDNVKDNIVDLTNTDNTNVNRRSNFNRTRSLYEDRMYGNSKELETPRKTIRELLEEESEIKNYNINDVMDMARKNRTLEDEEEKKKKIKSAEYSILSDLSQEKLKEYRERKEKGISREEEAALDELIHTITSKSLRKKIDDELFNDLLPDSDDEETVSRDLINEISDAPVKMDESDDEKEYTKDQVENTADLENGLDKSFYTRSMDLKREDLILNDDEEEPEDDSYEDGKNSVFKIILTIVIVTVLVAVFAYVIYKYA